MDRDKLRRSLEKRLAELGARLAKIETHLRDPGSKDSEERAIELENEEVLERLDASERDEIAQIRAALRRIDAGRYGDGWEDAAPLLKGSMPKPQWETGLVRARGPLGVLVARKIRLASCTRGTQADPEAEICVIQYDSQFERRPLADERVTVLKGKDGTWRVFGQSGLMKR